VLTAELTINVRILDRRAQLPEYATAGASGMDVRALLDVPLVLAPGQRAALPTGLALEIPSGFELQVRPRSGLALGRGLTVLNAPGTIDSDYRGELKVLLINLDNAPQTIQPGERIAQLVVAPVLRAQLRPTETLQDTARGGGGFGSTGCA